MTLITHVARYAVKPQKAHCKNCTQSSTTVKELLKRTHKQVTLTDKRTSFQQ